MTPGGRFASPIIDAICEESEVLAERAPGRLAGAPVDLLTTFARLLYAKAPPEFFQGRSTTVLAEAALADFHALDRARPERVDVEVTNPDVDTEGWYAPVTVIRTNVSERPFIVDSIREYLNERGLAIERFLHPVLRVVRDHEGAVVEVGPVTAGPPLESWVHCEIARLTEGARMDALRSDIAASLGDVVRATEDFGAMMAALDETIAYLDRYGERLADRRTEIEEVEEFLRWLRDGAFVFLGYRGYDILDDPQRGRAITVEPGSGLGILRDETASTFSEPVPLETLRPGLRARVAGGPLLIISKTNAPSTVHRRVRMDYIGVKKLDAQGGVAGERRFIGLFTSQAYSEDAEQIPILREKLRAILQDAAALPGSYDYKEIITIFNSMPKEELFLSSAEEIGAEIQTALALYGTREIRVTLRPDPLDRGVSVMVIMPKDRFSGEVRQSLEEALVGKLGGAVLNYHLALGGGDQARLHFYLSTAPDNLAGTEASELEQIVRRLIRTWADRVREELERVRPVEQARRLAQRFTRAFAPDYQAATDPAIAREDILELDALATERRPLSVRLRNANGGGTEAGQEPVTILKLYLIGERLVLSDFMPILDNAGVRVISVRPFEIAGDDVPRAHIYAFAVQDPYRRPIEVERIGGLLSDALLAVHAGDAVSDELNCLILTAGLAWREVDVLRAYSEYAFQLGAVPSRRTLLNALRAYPGAARLLFRLFAIKFDPAITLRSAHGAAEASAIQQDFIRSLEGVASLGDDRALRRLVNLIDATVRTNYFVTGGAGTLKRSGGVPYLSFKFSGDALQAIVRTRLRFEVWVQSARLAGVHLRGARVARGGIRFSDRPDDFRTEIFGLVKTQHVKNAVIVPAGSKGGFIVKQAPSDPQGLAAEAAEQYRTLIRGLLDLTDNLVDGEVRHPEGLVVYDGPDPYLVVAADKGTAHLSDVANAVAGEYGFWLGDAFASGGSNGYDHKTVGITARGTWVCVQRHFHEAGRDIQAEPFTVVGIGDMSGDVFGNGMLLSRQIRLIGAFDHRHIFIDPSPDAERSYAERERLFRAGRTTWADYDRDVLSPGGFIVPRGSKEVRITPEVRDALGLEPDTALLDGEGLIKAVLRAPVDLLWNGGIGTYVKADFESHGDVGDSANDAVRVDANELRCQGIGEGGNLGLTQAARVAFALRGGRLNTDALDNAGGVNMSDHEVNLKILLSAGVAAGRMDMPMRNRLLRELTEPVTELVLADNRSQSLAVSLDELRGAEIVEDLLSLMTRLERDQLLDRASEALPTAYELADRRGHQQMTRPELAVLLAYSKLALKQTLRQSPLPEDAAVARYLIDYFPAAAIQRAGQDALAAHRLRAEIIASQLTNDLVDLMGATFVHRVARDTGQAPVDVARAWVIAARLCGARTLRQALNEIEAELSTEVVYRWLLGLARVLERTTRWVLRNVAAAAPTMAVIDEHLDGLAKLRERFDEIVTGADRVLFEERVAEMRQLTEKYDLAQRLITLRFLDQLLEILRVGRETGLDPIRVGKAYYRTSELLELPWLRQAIADTAGDDRWEQRLADELLDDVGRAHRKFTARVVTEGGADEALELLIERVLERRARDVAGYLELVAEVRGSRPTLAALGLAVRELVRLGRR